MAGGEVEGDDTAGVVAQHRRTTQAEPVEQGGGGVGVGLDGRLSRPAAPPSRPCPACPWPPPAGGTPGGESTRRTRPTTGASGGGTAAADPSRPRRSGSARRAPRRSRSGWRVPGSRPRAAFRSGRRLAPFHDDGGSPVAAALAGRPGPAATPQYPTAMRISSRVSSTRSSTSTAFMPNWKSTGSPGGSPAARGGPWAGPPGRWGRRGLAGCWRRWRPTGRRSARAAGRSAPPRPGWRW